MPRRSVNIGIFIAVIGCIAAILIFFDKSKKDVEIQETNVPAATEKDTVVEKKENDNLKEGTTEKSSSEQNTVVSESSTNQVVTGQISSKELKNPEEELEERVNTALSSQTEVKEKGDVVRGQLSNQEAIKAGNTQDSVIRRDFVTDLARWLSLNYTPPQIEGRHGHTSATLKKANLRYCNSTTLKGTGRDEFKRRKSILNYVLTEGNLEALYSLYQKRLLDSMEEQIRIPRKNRELNNAAIADFFEVYADLFHRISLSMDAVSRINIKEAIQSISETDKKENKINEEFALAYTAYSAARDSGNQAEAERQGAIMSRKSREGRELDFFQEKQRAALVSVIRGNSTGKLLSDSELLFLSEWLVRHNCSGVLSSKIAGLCEQISAECHVRAIQINQQGTKKESSIEGEKTEIKKDAASSGLNTKADPNQPVDNSGEFLQRKESQGNGKNNTAVTPSTEHESPSRKLQKLYNTPAMEAAKELTVQKK